MMIQQLARTFAMVAVAGLLAACVSNPSTTAAPSGITAGSSGLLACAQGTLDVRASLDGRTVRIGTQQGSVELARVTDGVFTGSGYQLNTKEPGGATLWYQGKVQSSHCRPS